MPTVRAGPVDPTSGASRGASARTHRADAVYQEAPVPSSIADIHSQAAAPNDEATHDLLPISSCRRIVRSGASVGRPTRPGPAFDPTIAALRFSPTLVRGPRPGAIS